MIPHSRYITKYCPLGEREKYVCMYACMCTTTKLNATSMEDVAVTLIRGALPSMTGGDFYTAFICPEQFPVKCLYRLIKPEILLNRGMSAHTHTHGLKTSADRGAGRSRDLTLKEKKKRRRQPGSWRMEPSDRRTGDTDRRCIQMRAHALTNGS